MNVALSIINFLDSEDRINSCFLLLLPTQLLILSRIGNTQILGLVIGGGIACHRCFCEGMHIGLNHVEGRRERQVGLLRFGHLALFTIPFYEPVQKVV